MRPLLRANYKMHFKLFEGTPERKHFKIKDLDVIPTPNTQSSFDTQGNIFHVGQRNIRKIF